MPGLRKAGLGHQATGGPMVNHYLHFGTIVGGGNPSFSGAVMRSISALLACVSLLAGSAAWADSRVFIIANQPDGYGVDQCLAQGREVRRPCRPVLLSVAEFCAGLFVPPGRSGRNHRLGSEGKRKLRPFGLRRIHRDHLPALNSAHSSSSRTATVGAAETT